MVFTAGPGRRLLCPPRTVFPAPPLLFLPLSHSSQLPQYHTYQNMKSTCFLFLVDVRQRYCFSHLSWNPIITRACVCRRARACVHKSLGVCHMITDQRMTSCSRIRAPQRPPVEAAPHYWFRGAFKDQLLLHVYASKGKRRSVRSQTDVTTRPEMTRKFVLIFVEQPVPNRYRPYFARYWA